MKIRIYGTAVLLGSILLLASFAMKQPANPLVGIWELQMNDGPTGLLKIFNADGRFTGIGLADEGMGISLEGTYELKSADSYREKVVRSAFSEQEGTEKTVRFRIIKDSLLLINYSISGENFSEEYRKLQMIKAQ